MMNCTVCGGTMEAETTDLPFKVSAKCIIILKSVPVLQCGSCTEFLIEDPVYAQVEGILASADKSAELEVIQFAA